MSRAQLNLGTVEAEFQLRKRRSRWRAHRPGLAAGALLALIVLAAVCAPLIAPHDPNRVALLDKLVSPMGQGFEGDRYLLGTDPVGRDILSRVLYGARISILVGVGAVIISGSVGVLLGLAAGYFGKRIDDTIMRLADVQLAFPIILLAIALLAVLGQGLRNIIIVLALVGWVPYARIVRATTLSLREREFVQAAAVSGATNARIVLQHVLPNVSAPATVVASFAVANTIIAEASLSFLGLGVGVNTPSWGSMLAESRNYLLIAWWPATFPGIAIMLTVLAINILGDAARDVLDPRLRL